MLYEIIEKIVAVIIMIGIVYTTYCLFKMTTEREREREKTLKGLLTSMFPLNLFPQFHGPSSKYYYNRFVGSLIITIILLVCFFLFFIIE